MTSKVKTPNKISSAAMILNGFISCAWINFFEDKIRHRNSEIGRIKRVSFLPQLSTLNDDPQCTGMMFGSLTYK